MAFTKSDFELSSLSSLNAADVSQLLDELSTQLQELNPNLDLKRGVFKDTVAYYLQSLIGEVGGTLGLFLGLSTMSFIDFIEFIFRKLFF